MGVIIENLQETSVDDCIEVETLAFKKKRRSDRHGFATYIHLVQGFLSQQAQKQVRETLRCALALAYVAKGNVIVDTIVRPACAVIQLILLQSSSDMENNLIAFEHEKAGPDDLAPAAAHLQLAETSASGGV